MSENNSNSSVGSIELSYTPGQLPYKVEQIITTGKGVLPSLKLQLKNVVTTIGAKVAFQRSEDTSISLDKKTIPANALILRGPSVWDRIRAAKEAFSATMSSTNLPQDKLDVAFEELEKAALAKKHHLAVCKRSELKVLRDGQVNSADIDPKTLELVSKEEPVDESSDESK